MTRRNSLKHLSYADQLAWMALTSSLTIEDAKTLARDLTTPNPRFVSYVSTRGDAHSRSYVAGVFAWGPSGRAFYAGGDFDSLCDAIHAAQEYATKLVKAREDLVDEQFAFIPVIPTVTVVEVAQ